MTPDEAAAAVREALRPESTGCTCYGAGWCPVCKAHAALGVLVAAAKQADRLDDDQAVMRGVGAVRRMGKMRVGDIHDHAEAFRAALADDGAAR